MTYRSLQPSDLPALLRLEQAYMQEIEPDHVVRWMAALDRNLALWIECIPTSGVISNEEGQPVGLALWRLESTVATLVTIQVERSHRRSGLGERLLQAFLAAAAAGGCERAALGVHECNQKAERLYVKHGFQHVATEDAYRLFERPLEQA